MRLFGIVTGDEPSACKAAVLLAPQTSGADLGEWRPMEQDRDTPVVSSPDYGFMDPDLFSRWFRKFCVDNGFGTYSEAETFRDKSGVKRYVRKKYEGMKFHELRHTQATLFIGTSADIKTVQSRLGRSRTNPTMNIYAHAIQTNDEKAAEAISGILTLAKAAQNLQAQADEGPIAEPPREVADPPSEAHRLLRRRGELTTRETREATGIEGRKKLSAVMAKLISGGYIEKVGGNEERAVSADGGVSGGLARPSASRRVAIREKQDYPSGYEKGTHRPKQASSLSVAGPQPSLGSIAL